MQLPNLVSIAIRYAKGLIGFLNNEQKKDKIAFEVNPDIPNQNCDPENSRTEKKLKFLINENLAMKHKFYELELKLGNVLSKTRGLD